MLHLSTTHKCYCVATEEPEHGIFGAVSSSVAHATSKDAVAKQQADIDVDFALSAFEKSAKVPASIMEASIFKKPYFVGRSDKYKRLLLTMGSRR